MRFMNSFRFYGMKCSSTFEKQNQQNNITMEEQIKFYEHKLAFEMDPSDLFDALNNGEKVIALDARKSFWI